MKNTVRILCIVLMALLLCTGLIACAHKEAADHTATGEWLSDENNHWHACEKEKCEDAGDRAAHEFDNACDADCNVCGYKRTPAAHAYDNACDTACNVCGATREITHTPATALTAGDTTHWYACTVCGAKTGEVAHTFDKTVAHSDYLKAAATATTKAQYWKSCVCGKASATEYFESDKAPANLEITSDISKTYDGTPVLEPLYDSDGPGGEYFEYWQGTTKLSGKPTNAGTYKVVVGIYECETHAGDRVEREFTIAKKVLTNISLGDTTYKGSTSFSYALSAYHGLVSGDTFMLQVTTASKNVGTAVEIASISYTNNNYSLDKSAIALNILPKTLNYLNLTKVYDGKAGYNDSVFFLDTTHGLVAGDVVSIETNDDAEYNVGTYALTDTSGRWELDDCIYLEGADAANYAFNYQANGAVATITVTPKALKLLDLEFTYDGGNLASRFDLTAADGVIAGDDIYLSCDGWQSYDAAYDEYTLTDDLGSDDYDEGVTLFGADKGNYEFTYDTDGSVGKVTVLPYILDFTGEYVKDADGTNYFTFTQDVTWSQGGTQTVTVKIALVDKEGHWITAPGVYTQENAEIGDESFYIGSYKCEGFELDEDYYADEFKVTVLSSDDLILLATDRFNVGAEYIILVEVKQGTVKVGDSIVLPGTPDKVYEVLQIHKEEDREFVEYATVGDEVALYVDGMAALTEVSALSFLYEYDNIPEMATEFLAKLYLKTKDEGGRQTPVSNGYAPMLRGLGVPQQGTITIISHYAKEDAVLWLPGETVLAKITLTTPVPAALLHELEFTMAEGDLVTVTGVVVDGFIGSEQAGNSMLLTGAFNTKALTPIVVKITNTRDEALDTLELFVSNGNGGGSYLTDYTVELYDEDFVRILGAHNNTEGTFTKDDSTTWSLAAGETCYVVVKTTNATDGVFVRLM